MTMCFGAERRRLDDNLRNEVVGKVSYGKDRDI